MERCSFYNRKRRFASRLRFQARKVKFEEFYMYRKLLLSGICFFLQKGELCRAEHLTASEVRVYKVKCQLCKSNASWVMPGMYIPVAGDFVEI